MQKLTLVRFCPDLRASKKDGHMFVACSRNFA
jgi:hypothetical protein